MTWRLRSQAENFYGLSFALKFLGPHYFQTTGWILFMCSMMVDIGPKFYTVPSPYDLKVKVTDLEFLCLSFVLKFLEPHYFQNVWWILFKYGMMIDIGPSLCNTIPSPLCDLKVKVMDLEFLC